MTNTTFKYKNYTRLVDGIIDAKGERFALHAAKLTNNYYNNYVTSGKYDKTRLLAEFDGADGLYCHIFSAYSTLPEVPVPFLKAQLNECNRNLITPMMKPFKRIYLNKHVEVDDRFWRSGSYPSPFPSEGGAGGAGGAEAPFAYTIVGKEQSQLWIQRIFWESLTPAEIRLVDKARSLADDPDWDGSLPMLAQTLAIAASTAAAQRRSVARKFQDAIAVSPVGELWY